MSPSARTVTQRDDRTALDPNAPFDPGVTEEVPVEGGGTTEDLTTTQAHDRPAVEEVEPPLIGQPDAAQAIQTGIERAFSLGTPTLVALEGGRGSGRTRLLVYASEIAARLSPDVKILYGGCREGGGDGSYAPFSRVLLDRFKVTPSSSPSAVRGQMATIVGQALQTTDAIAVAETTHLLGYLAGIPFPDSPFLAPLRSRPEELHQRTCRAVRRFIEGDAQSRPVVLLLDNMEHAENDGWDVLAEISRAEAHIAIVLAGAPPVGKWAEELAPRGGVAIGPIEPLREEDVASMLHVLIPDLESAPEALVAAITHRSKGNPSALRELVRALREGGGFFIEESGRVRVDLERLAHGELPVTMDDAIRARLGRLDQFERATLDRAAVFGEIFWDWGILAQMRSERDAPGADAEPQSIWPDDEDAHALAVALGRLQQKGFIDRVETSLLPGAAEYTFALAGTRDLAYKEMDEELRISRHAAVARWLAVTAEYGREAVAGMIAPHLEKAGEHVRAGRAYLEAASYERARMRTGTALRFVEKSLELLGTEDIVRRIDALHVHGSLLTTAGRYDEANQAFVQMLRLAWRVGARGKGGAALARIARVHRQRGEDEKARTFFERALELFRDGADLRGVASTLDDLAQVQILRGEVELARVTVTEALEIRRAHGDTRGEAVSLTTLGKIELIRGNLDIAEGIHRQALELRQSIADIEGQMESYNALGIIAFERGDRETAVAQWTAALAQARESADRRHECFFLNNIGEARTQMGQLEAARESLFRAQELAAALGDKRASAEVERNLGLVALKLGDDSAGETLVRALKLAEAYGGKEAIALAHRAIGTLRARTMFDATAAGDRRAEESFLASIDLFREIGNEKEAARSLAELGYHLIERADLESARERLREARAIMRTIGLAELDKVEQTLKELGQG